MPAIRATMHSYLFTYAPHAEKPVFRILKWETHRHTKDWLANLASSTRLCKKNMRLNQP